MHTRYMIATQTPHVFKLSICYVNACLCCVPMHVRSTCSLPARASRSASEGGGVYRRAPLLPLLGTHTTTRCSCSGGLAADLAFCRVAVLTCSSYPTSCQLVQHSRHRSRRQALARSTHIYLAPDLIFLTQQQASLSSAQPLHLCPSKLGALLAEQPCLKSTLRSVAARLRPFVEGHRHCLYR